MLSVFLRDVLDDIWDLIGLVSEGFPTWFLINIAYSFNPHVILYIRFENGYKNVNSVATDSKQYCKVTKI